MYKPVGYVIIRHRLPDYKWHEDVAFFHHYEAAEQYCKEMNTNSEFKVYWYYEPNEVDIYD